MKKTPNYIKKTLDEAKYELLKEKQLQLSRQLYVEKLKELFSEEVIDLKENVETKMSITAQIKFQLYHPQIISYKKTTKHKSNQTTKFF